MSKFLDWVTSKFNHPLSLLFFLLGAVLVLLGLTTGLNIPGVQPLVSESNSRWAALILGIILLLASVLLYYRPPASTTVKPPAPEAPVIPEELKQNFAARMDSLSDAQTELLAFIRREGAGRKFVSQDTVEARFIQKGQAELYYRLEHLRLLGFLDRQRFGKNEQGYDRFAYRISDAYIKELGGAEPVTT
jgi:hypothetical protein